MHFQGKAIRLQLLPDGIAELCFDRAGDAVNKFDQLTLGELREVLQLLGSAQDARGVLICSAKPESFVVGADITGLVLFSVSGGSAAAEPGAGERDFQYAGGSWTAERLCNQRIGSWRRTRIVSGCRCPRHGRVGANRLAGSETWHQSRVWRNGAIAALDRDRQCRGMDLWRSRVQGGCGAGGWCRRCDRGSLEASRRGA